MKCKIVISLLSILGLHHYAQSQINEKQPFVSQELEEVKVQTNNKKIPDSDLPITKEVAIGKGMYRIKQGYLYGIEVNGEIKIPPQYNKLQMDYEPYMEATKGYDSKNAAKYGYAGIISAENEVIIPFVYSSATLHKKYNTVLVCTPKENKVCGVCDLKSNPIVPLIYKQPCSIGQFKKYPNVAYVCNDASRTYFYDSTGLLISEYPFARIYEVEADCYQIYNPIDYKVGLSDSEFNIIIDPVYQMFYWKYENYVCFSYFKEDKMHKVIVDIEDGKVKLDLIGQFELIDDGKFNHVYNKNGKQIRDRYDLNTFKNDKE